MEIWIILSGRFESELKAKQTKFLWFSNMAKPEKKIIINFSLLLTTTMMMIMVVNGELLDRFVFFSTGNSNTHKVFHNSILLVIIKCSTLRRLLLLFWFLILDIFSFFFCTKVKWGKVCNRIRYIFGHRQQQQWNAVANFHFFKFWKKQPVKINHHNLDIQNNNRHHHHYQFIWELKF